MLFARLTNLAFSAFHRPRRRKNAGSRTVQAGFESLEDRRVLSSTGWEPGFNFEQESNDTRALADALATTTPTSPDADVVITGGIRSVSDVDFYKFTLHSQADVQLDLYKLHPDRYRFAGDLDLELVDSSGTRIELSNRGGGSPERIETTLDAGTYFARVYPYDSSGFGVSYQLRLQSEGQNNPVVPGKPTVTGPEDTSDATPAFTWTSAANATRYELWVYNRDLNTRVLHNTQLTGTTFTPSADMESGVHYVWVRAWNGNTPGSWSAGLAFTLEADQQPLEVIAPGDTNEARPEFRWTEQRNATHYELWVTNLTTGNRVLYDSRIEGVAFTPDRDLQPGQHVVWVRAWNGSQALGGWSTPHRFTLTGQGLNRPEVLAPGDTDDATPTFTWTASNGATHYELWVSNTTVNRRVLYRNNLQSTSFTAPDDLPSGNYTVWVRAWNGSSNSGWSQAHRFVLTAAENPDPNGSNNTRATATGLANGTRNDLLTSEDETDFYFVAASQRYPRVRFEWTIEVTSGNADDVSISLQDGNGELIGTSSYSVTRTGNTITVSSDGRYFYMRLRGYRVNLQMQLAPGAEDVRYTLTASSQTTV